MEHTAAARGTPQDTIKSGLSACINVIASNGYDLKETVEPAFVSRLARAIAGNGLTQDPDLVLSPTDATLKNVLGDMLHAYDECCKQDAEYESMRASTTGTPEIPATLQRTTTPAEQSISQRDCLGSINGSATFNYDALMAAHLRGRPNIEKKTTQNEISALRTLIARLGQRGTDDFRWMADQKEFDARIAACNLKSDRTCRSALNQVRRTACSLVVLANPANTLWESYLRAYHKHVDTGGKAELMSKVAFILHCFNATGISRRRLNAKKILVHAETFERVKKLEDSLGADGELTRWLINMSDNNMKVFQTEYGKRVGEAVKFRYALTWENWPEALKREWNELFLLRTEPLKASRKWGLHLEKVPKRTLWTWRVRRHDRSCPSANKQRQEMECFFGWCLLPKVLLSDGEKNFWRSGPDETISKEDLSLGLVTNQDLFDGYMAFRKAHTFTEAEIIAGEIGRFNRSCKTFIELTSSLLNPLTGFIYLRKDLYFNPDEETPSATNLAPLVGHTFYKAELRKEVKVTDPDERWYCFCRETRDYMEQTREQEFDPALKTRSGDPIARILALDDPMVAVAELLQKIDEAEPVVDYWRHFHRRKKLFFMMISVCPLRILQFALMTGHHLVKMQPADGAAAFYQIHFTNEEFKNERFIPERDYWFDLPEDFTSFIDSYLRDDWPAINGRSFTADDRVFSGRPYERTTKDEAQKRKVVIERIKLQLSDICRETTARHLGAKYKTPGFYPHAFRHIEATSVIKVTGSYEEAALLLWDAVETVRRAYAHVKRVEQLTKVSRNHYTRMSHALAKARELYLIKPQMSRQDQQ
jgi:hypothetical protein